MEADTGNDDEDENEDEDDENHRDDKDKDTDLSNSVNESWSRGVRGSIPLLYRGTFLKPEPSVSRLQDLSGKLPWETLAGTFYRPLWKPIMDLPQRTVEGPKTILPRNLTMAEDTKAATAGE